MNTLSGGISLFLICVTELEIFKYVVEKFRNLEPIDDPTNLISDHGLMWCGIQLYPGYNVIKLMPYDRSTPVAIIGSFKEWKFSDLIYVSSWESLKELGIEFDSENFLPYLAYKEVENGYVILCDYSLLTDEIPEPLPTQEELDGRPIKGIFLELDTRLQ